MDQRFLALFGEDARIEGDKLITHCEAVPIHDGIPRFVDSSYAEGNFSRLRQEFPQLQFDSYNGTSDRRDTILDRTGWAPGFFKGKLVLECGCGAGPDTEVLLGFGATVVAVDLTGVDVARRNLEGSPNVCFVQADISQLPFVPGSFDIVFCHRVIMHTPAPAKVLNHILTYAKPDGAVFVHSYARRWEQMLRWKYALRPITRRMNPEGLYRLIELYSPVAQRLTAAIDKVPGGRYFNHAFIPFLNKRLIPKFATLSDEEAYAFSIHDTFDALSPRYDSPLKAEEMRSAATAHLRTPWEVVERRTVTLLRTKV